MVLVERCCFAGVFLGCFISIIVLILVGDTVRRRSNHILFFPATKPIRGK